MSFQREEIYYVSNGYILSENLVKDCRLRVEIGKFIRSAIMENSDEDREFARENSKEIVGVLQRVWNSPNFSSDGMHHEKYTLLMSDRGITDEALALLMGQLLKEEGIYSPELGSEGEIFYTLLYRRLPSLVPMILDALKHEEKEKDFTGQVYALFLLQRDTSDKKYLAKMKAIAKNPEVSDAARKVLEKIISKIEKKEKIDSEYFGDFGYALINNKSLMK